MGYLGNHLATLVTGVFAAVLTGLWPFFVDFAPVLNFVFIMAVPITWFLTAMCWISQRSADYMKKWEAVHSHGEKKSLNNTQTSTNTQLASATEIKDAKTELSNKLDTLKETVKLKDSEIDRLNQEIANLKTLVEIESLKSELANLKILAAQGKTRRTRKN